VRTSNRTWNCLSQRKCRRGPRPGEDCRPGRTCQTNRARGSPSRWTNRTLTSRAIGMLILKRRTHPSSVCSTGRGDMEISKYEHRHVPHKLHLFGPSSRPKANRANETKRTFASLSKSPLLDRCIVRAYVTDGRSLFSDFECKSMAIFCIWSDFSEGN
jgi:hypothetical protein